MAQVRAFVRESVPEKLFAGEELEIRVVDPALAHPLIGQPVDMLEQQQPDHEAGLDPRPAVLAVERRDLAVDPVPIDLAGKQNQLVLQIDDLVQPRPEQIVRSRRLVLLRPHRHLRCTTELWAAGKGNPKAKLQGLAASTSHSGNLKPPGIRKKTPAQSLRTLFTDDYYSVRILAWLRQLLPLVLVLLSRTLACLPQLNLSCSRFDGHRVKL